MTHIRAWAVILAGGNGTRVQSLTRLICQEDRPKQFCPLLGSQTLLAQTRSRIAQAIDPERTLVTVVKAHERYFEEQLADLRPSRIVVQPSNKGTTAAIVYSLIRLSRLNPRAIACFFPADHYFARDSHFVRAVEGAVEIAAHHPESVVLLGARPRHAETAYGYIEPGSPVKPRLRHPAFWVTRFWEKPALEDARKLVERGCLWNTFVMVGGLTAFLGILQSTTPHLLRLLWPLRHSHAVDREIAYAKDAYRTLEPSDFSQHVLARSSQGAAVLDFGDSDWSDLGEPERVMAVRAQLGMPAPVDGSGSRNSPHFRPATARESGGFNRAPGGASALLADREDPGSKGER